MRLNPRCGQARKTVMGADRQQVGESQHSSRQHHEEEAGNDPQAQQNALAALDRDHGHDDRAFL